VEKFGDFLSGYKTIFAAVAVALVVALQTGGVITDEQAAHLVGLLTAFGLLAARAATKTATGR